MKLFYIPTMLAFLTFTLLTSAVQAAPDIRQYSAIGTKNFAKRVLNKPKKGWFTDEWNKTMASIVNDSRTCAFDNHYPAQVAKFHWSDAYVNERIKPTRSQARNPNWSNYVWNQKDKNADYVFDGISDALNSEQVNNGRGIAKLSVIVGLTASSGTMIPPQWMRADRSLTWLEGTNTNGYGNSWHVRFDNPVAVDHAVDFLAAFLAKYGSNKGLHSVNIGEYYLGADKYIPKQLSRNKYLLGVKNLWSKVVQAAPRDENGQRVNIVQTNPILNSTVTISDLESAGMGVSESDSNLHFYDANTNAVARSMKQLYDGKKLHVMINGDSRYACRGFRQGWDGTPNPFGHRKGYSGVATPQEIFWYHGENGPLPTHSFFMTIARQCSGPQTKANFIDAVKRFGRCGTETSKWGASPATFSKGNRSSAKSIVTSKPQPPEIAIN